ncbi:14479_t:CDS:2, partial [Dentiscutata erythropus]
VKLVNAAETVETKSNVQFESLTGLVFDVVKHLKKRQVNRKCYRPRLCYVCRRQGHLAHSFPDQGKRINETFKDESNTKRKKDTMPNDEIQDVRIFRCVDVKGRGFVGCCCQNKNDVRSNESNHDKETKKEEMVVELNDKLIEMNKEKIENLPALNEEMIQKIKHAEESA